MVTTASLEELMLDAAKELFESMIFMPLERSATAGPDTGDMAFLATITFIGNLEGCFGISCDDSSARALAASMLCMTSGEPLSETDVTDAIGEIANMIMGGIKTRVQQDIARIEISIPSVIRGRQLQNRPGEGMSRIILHVTLGQEHHASLSLLYRYRGN